MKEYFLVESMEMNAILGLAVVGLIIGIMVQLNDAKKIIIPGQPGKMKRLWNIGYTVIISVALGIYAFMCQQATATILIIIAVIIISRILSVKYYGLAENNIHCEIKLFVNAGGSMGAMFPIRNVHKVSYQKASNATLTNDNMDKVILKFDMNQGDEQRLEFDRSKQQDIENFLQEKELL